MFLRKIVWSLMFLLSLGKWGKQKSRHWCSGLGVCNASGRTSCWQAWEFWFWRANFSLAGNIYCLSGWYKVLCDVTHEMNCKYSVIVQLLAQRRTNKSTEHSKSHSEWTLVASSVVLFFRTMLTLSCQCLKNSWKMLLMMPVMMLSGKAWSFWWGHWQNIWTRVTLKWNQLLANW